MTNKTDRKKKLLDYLCYKHNTSPKNFRMYAKQAIDKFIDFWNTRIPPEPSRDVVEKFKARWCKDVIMQNGEIINKSILNWLRKNYSVPSGDVSVEIERLIKAVSDVTTCHLKSKELPTKIDLLCMALEPIIDLLPKRLSEDDDCVSTCQEVALLRSQRLSKEEVLRRFDERFPKMDTLHRNMFKGFLSEILGG